MAWRESGYAWLSRLKPIPLPKILGISSYTSLQIVEQSYDTYASG